MQYDSTLLNKDHSHCVRVNTCVGSLATNRMSNLTARALLWSTLHIVLNFVMSSLRQE